MSRGTRELLLRHRPRNAGLQFIQPFFNNLQIVRATFPCYRHRQSLRQTETGGSNDRYRFDSCSQRGP